MPPRACTFEKWNSGMRQPDRKPEDPVFRPRDNSPSPRHLTPDRLLCL